MVKRVKIEKNHQHSWHVEVDSIPHKYCRNHCCEDGHQGYNYFVIATCRCGAKLYDDEINSLLYVPNPMDK